VLCVFCREDFGLVGGLLWIDLSPGFLFVDVIACLAIYLCFFAILVILLNFRVTGWQASGAERTGEF
jgi:hypothetical protein